MATCRFPRIVLAGLALLGLAWGIGTPFGVGAQTAPAGSLDRAFTCHEAENAAGAAAFDPRVVTLADQFETREARVIAPALFCDPALAPSIAGIGDGAEHLACYDIEDQGVPPFAGRTVEVTNLLGQRRLRAERAKLLCVPSTAVGSSPPAELDHFKCYETSSAGGVLPAPLEDALGDPFRGLGPLEADLCNPVDKNAEGLNDPETHLVCHDLAEPPPVPLREVSFQNQFGEQRWQLGLPGRVCLPSGKREIVSGPRPTATPLLPLPTLPIDLPSTPTPTPTPTLTPGSLPPDPSTVAPANDPSVATSHFGSTRFLYTGEDPIQTGVAPGTIDPVRAAVIRGKVRDTIGAPLSGVTVAILDRPELGETLSRADGAFDLAVNGGGPLFLTYTKEGFLPSQRRIEAPWQDFVIAEDVALVLLDPKVTTVDLAAPGMKVAQGSVVSDADGERQATVLFPEGVTATMTLPDGTTQPLTSLDVRATEYTVGPNGPKAMPGELPPTSAYTYAVELSVDQAMAAGAEQVTFSRPVIQYLENFLDFPVGTIVPVGFYDRGKAAWLPSENGRVVRIVGVTDGRADLDTDGDGLADDGAEPPITDDERREVASLYAPGQSLWRFPIEHFTPFDCNWPFTLPPDAEDPEGSSSGEEDPLEKCLEGLAETPVASVVECQNQILGERIRVVGTPFTLDYRSDRVPGPPERRSLEFELSGEGVPESLERIEFTLHVAGQVVELTRDPLPNQKFRFDWDGRDAYGRPVQGNQRFSATIEYVYTGQYTEPAGRRAFGNSGGSELPPETRPGQRALQQTLTGVLPAIDARGWGLGGWTLSGHHLYDVPGKVLYLGDGRRVSVDDAITSAIETVAGRGGSTPNPDGIPAREAQIFSPYSVAVAPDGDVFFSTVANLDTRIYRVDRAGVIHPFAGNGIRGFSGDGGPATQAQLDSPLGLTFGPEGSLYIADTFNHRIRRVGPDGIITTVAGTGVAGFAGDEGPATAAKLDEPFDVAFGPDGSLYIADENNGRVRRVGPDGTITTVAGGGTDAPSDGAQATRVSLNGVESITVDRSGVLYLAGDIRLPKRSVVQVGVDGVLRFVAGDSCVTGAGSGDGGPARQACLNLIEGMTTDADGSLYLADNANGLRVVSRDGLIFTVAGGGNNDDEDGVPAPQADLSAIDAAVGPDGSILVTDNLFERVRRISAPLPGFTAAPFAVASSDGSLLYRFAPDGRHVQTHDALTGAIVRSFAYDAQGRLISILDGDGNETTIERDPDGLPTAIVAPFGQRTLLALDVNGFLSAVTNPADETVRMTYTPDGLLASLTDPRGNTSSYEYDGKGRLTVARDAAGGSNTLTRTSLGPRSHEVTRTTALGRTSTYRVERLDDGDLRLTNIAPDGTQSIFEHLTDGTRISRLPDGTVESVVLGPDPRFGMQAPLPASVSVRTPAGREQTRTVLRAVTLGSAGDPLSLETLTDTITVNFARQFTRIYDRASNTLTAFSPEGRERITTLDPLGRPVRHEIQGIEPFTYTYDARGRLTTVRQGSGPTARTTELAYDGNGFLQRLDQPEGLSSTFSTDAAGRLDQALLPGNRAISYDYDPSGNLTSMIPPGQPAHRFAYDARNHVTSYTAPDAGDGPEEILLTRNADRELTGRRLPDGRAIDVAYGASTGKIAGQTLGRGAIAYGFDSQTGQLATITAPGGVGLSYENDGPLLSRLRWTGPVAGTVDRGHDDEFRTTSLTVNGGPPLFYGYDQDGLLVAAGALTVLRDQATGRVSTTALGSVDDSRQYGPFGEVVGYAASFAGAPLFDLELSRDGLGRIVERKETIGGVTSTRRYVYDAASRLAEVRENDTPIASYDYDDNGNRLSATTAGGTVAGIYDSQDRLLEYGSTTYRYDSVGQLASKTDGGGTTTYAYDEAGNLVGVALPDGTTLDYLIDGANRRIGKKVGGALVQGFLYQDRFRPIAELDAGGNVVARFAYGSPGIVPTHVIKGGSTFRILTDPIGSPRLVVDVASGEIAQRMDYDEFGNVTLDTNPGFQPFGFAGGLYDPVTRLVRFGVRDYDAETGRFTAKDPKVLSENSLYAYAANDPVNLVDFLGRAPNDDWWDEWVEVIEEALGDGFDPRDTQVDLSLPDEIAERHRITELWKKIDELAEHANRKLNKPVTICLFVLGIAGLSERAEANEQSVVEQATEELVLPVEGETISEALEEFFGAIKDAIQGSFEELAQRRI